MTEPNDDACVIILAGIVNQMAADKAALLEEISRLHAEIADLHMEYVESPQDRARRANSTRRVALKEAVRAVEAVAPNEADGMRTPEWYGRRTGILRAVRAIRVLMEDTTDGAVRENECLTP